MVIETRETSAVAVRCARPEDAAVIATLHVAAWHETYAGLLPDAMIAALTVEVRQAWWAQLLATPPPTLDRMVYLAEFHGEPAGFGTCNRQRAEGLAAAGFDGEVSSLYVLRAAQGRGVGLALMARSLRNAEYRAAAAWVLRANRIGRRFYERRGATRLEAEACICGQGRFTEVAYGWRDLASADPGPWDGVG